MAIGDTGIPPTFKRPGFIAKIHYAAGAVGAGSQRLKCLLVGMKTSAGSMTADQDIVGPVTDEDEADAYAGVGSQLAMMAYQALKVPGVELYMAAVTEPGGGTAATATITITGSVTQAGVLEFRIAGKTISVAVAATDSVDTVVTNIAAAINAYPRLPVTAAANTSTDIVTVTVRNKGAQGRLWSLYADATDGPGVGVAIEGSAEANPGGEWFGASSTGTGSEDATTLLTKLTTERYARIAVGHNDTINAPLWETAINTNGGPLSLLLEQFIMGHNGTKASAKSLAQTTLNAFLGQVVWMRNSESHPCELAAWVAAHRSVNEQTNPVPDYDNLEMPYIAPQAFPSDFPSDPEQDEVLNAGVTPVTTINGSVRMVRAITTYCKTTGNAQDERCLDIGDATFPQYATMDLKALYDTDFRPSNPYVGPDPAPEQEPPPPGVGYPALWNGAVIARAESWYRSGWTEYPPTGSWEPKSGFNAAGRYIVDEIPMPVRRVQHRLDQVVRQVFNQV